MIQILGLYAIKTNTVTVVVAQGSTDGSDNPTDARHLISAKPFGLKLHKCKHGSDGARDTLW